MLVLKLYFMLVKWYPLSIVLCGPRSNTGYRNSDISPEIYSLAYIKHDHLDMEPLMSNLICHPTHIFIVIGVPRHGINKPEKFRMSQRNILHIKMLCQGTQLHLKYVLRLQIHVLPCFPKLNITHYQKTHYGWAPFLLFKHMKSCPLGETAKCLHIFW